MRRALLLLPLVAAGLVVLLLSESERGRAREPARAARDAVRPPDVSCAVAGEEAPATANAAISGAVVDGAGRPFPGARVRVFRGTDPDLWADAPPPLLSPVSTLAADAGGRFATTVRSDTAWLVVADAAGCVPAMAIARRGVERWDTVLALFPGARQRIRVVDDEGRPVAGAEALLAQPGGALRAAVRADGQGFVDTDLAPKEVLLVRAPGYAWELVEPPIDPPEVALEREYRIGGVVVLGDGSPVAGVRISFERYLWVDEVVTAADGTFLAGGLGENEVQLTVTPPGRDFFGETVQPGDERIRIVVPTANVEGVVLLPDGRPAASALVEHMPCDEAGRFALRDLPPGERTIDASFRAPGVHLAGRVRLAVGAADITGVRIKLEPAPLSFVRVVMVDARGAPVDAAIVHVGGRRHDDFEWLEERQGRGTLELEDAPGTEVVLYGRKGNELRGTTRAVTAATADGAAVKLRLDPPELPVAPVVITIVCRAADGSPLPADVAPRVWIYRASAREIAPDGPGRHRFEVRAVEEMRIDVRAPGYAPASLDWTPPPGGGEVEIRLPPAVRIKGRVFDPDGDAADMIDLRATGELSAASYDGPGCFSIDTGPGLRVVVTAQRGPVPGLVLGLEAPATGTLDLGDIPLAKPWVLRGTVVDGGGMPVGGAAVFVRGPGYEGKRLTRGDGTFRLESPPSDLFTVVAEKDGTRESGPVPATAFLREPQILRLP